LEEAMNLSRDRLILELDVTRMGNMRTVNKILIGKVEEKMNWETKAWIEG
jgi:hypothetical protein